MSEERECEDDVDIYGDLPNFSSLDDTVKELEEVKKELVAEVTRLKEKLDELTTEKNELDSKNKALGLNISSLFKTASAEIERKDRMIADIRKERDVIIFRRNRKHIKEADVTPNSSDNQWANQDTHDYHDQSIPDPYFDQKDVLQEELDYEDAEYSSPFNSTSQDNFIPQNERTLYSKRQLLRMAPENNVTKSNENIDPESTFQWNLLPLSEMELNKDVSEKTNYQSTRESKEHNSISQIESRKEIKRQEVHVKSKKSYVDVLETESNKDTNEKVNYSSAHISREYNSAPQIDSRKEFGRSEYSGYLPKKRDTYYSKSKSDGVHDKTNFSVDSSKGTLYSSKEFMSRHLYEREEYKSYSKYKSGRYSHSISDRPRTHSTYSSSDHLSHSKQWGSYKIPRTTRESSVSRALRSLRSRSVSQSRIIPKSVIKVPKKRSSNFSGSSYKKNSLLAQTLDMYTSHRSELSDNDSSTCVLRAELPSETKTKISKHLNSKTQILESSRKIKKSDESVKLQTPSSADNQIKLNTSGDMIAFNSNLSEHCSFKRSGRAKIIKSNSETKSNNIRKLNSNCDMDKITNNKPSCDSKQNRGIKRSHESKEIDEVHLPDNKRQALDDITGKECYNFRESDNSEDKQKCNDKSNKQPSSGSVSENTSKFDKFFKEESEVFEKADVAMLQETNKQKEEKEDKVLTRSNELNLEDGEIEDDESDTPPTTENTSDQNKKATSSLTTNSDCPPVNERDKNHVTKRETESQQNEFVKCRSDRKASDTKRKTVGSFRPHHVLKRYSERSRTPIRFNSHCKRRSPSELLSKDRVGRRLSSQDEKDRNTRSRSRSFEEGGRIYRGSERYKIADNPDGRSERYKIAGNSDGRDERYKRNKFCFEEERKKTKNPKDENKSVNYQNYKEKCEVAQIEVDATKERKIRRRESSNSNNQNMCFSETNKEDNISKFRKSEEIKGQTETIESMENVRPFAFDEKQKCDSKDMQYEQSKQNNVGSLVCKEIIKTDALENQISFPKGNSDELNSENIQSRCHNFEEGSERCTRTVIYDYTRVKNKTKRKTSEDERETNKDFKDENKKLCASKHKHKEKDNEISKTVLPDVIENEISRKDEDSDEYILKTSLLESKAGTTVKLKICNGARSEIEHALEESNRIVNEKPKSDYDDTYVKYKTKGQTSKDERKINKYPKDENKKLCAPKNKCEEKDDEILRTPLSAETENEVSRKVEYCDKNILKTSLPESKDEDTALKLKLYNGTKSEIQCTLKDKKEDIVNEEPKSDCDEVQHETCKQVVTEPKRSKKIADVSENSNNTICKTKAIMRLRSKSCEERSNMPIELDKYKRLDYLDTTFLTLKQNIVDYDSATKRNSYSSNATKMSTITHNYNEYKGKNKKILTEVKQMETGKINETKPNRGEGNVIVKEKSLSKTDKNDRIVKPKIHDHKTELLIQTDTADTQQKERSSVKQPTIEQMSNERGNFENEECKKTGSQNMCNTEESKISTEEAQKCKKPENINRRCKTKLTFFDNEEKDKNIQKNEIEFENSAEKKASRRAKSYNRNTQQISSSDTHTDKMEDAVSSTINETLNFNFEASCNALSKLPITDSLASNNGYTNKRENARITRSRSKSSEREERRPIQISAEKIISKDGHNSEIIKKSNAAYKYDKRKEENEHENDGSQMELDSAEVNRRDGNCIKNIQNNGNLEGCEDIMKSRMQNNCVEETESEERKVEYVTPGTKDNDEKSIHSELQHLSSKQPRSESSVPNDILKAGNDTKRKTRSRTKSNKEDGCINSKYEENITSTNSDRRGVSYRTRRATSVHERNRKEKTKSFQDYEENKEKSESENEAVQVDLDNSKKRKREREDTKNISQMNLPKKNMKEAVVNSDIHNCRIDKMKSLEESPIIVSQSMVHKKSIYKKHQFKLLNCDTNVISLTSNGNEKGRITRSRSKNCEGLQNHKETNVFCGNSRVNQTIENSEEQRERNKISKHETKNTNNSHFIKGSQRKEDKFEHDILQMKKLEMKLISEEEDSVMKHKKLDSYESQRELATRIENVESSRINEEVELKLQDDKFRTLVSDEMLEKNPTVKIFSFSSEPSICKATPVFNLKFRARKRSKECKLEDSRTVLSVNITPPKDVRKVVDEFSIKRSIMCAETSSTVSNEYKQMDNESQNLNESKNSSNINLLYDDSASHDLSQEVFSVKRISSDVTERSDNVKLTHKPKDMNEKINSSTISSNKGNTNAHELKTGVNFRKKYANVFAHSQESDKSSEEGEFDSSSSSDSDQNSDETWHPKKGSAKKSKKTRSHQSKHGVKSKTKHDQNKSKELS